MAIYKRTVGRRSEAYGLGLRRGSATGREEPWDRDWQWLADETDGRIQTDQDDCHDFACGMRDGARAAAEAS